MAAADCPDKYNVGYHDGLYERQDVEEKYKTKEYKRGYNDGLLDCHHIKNGGTYPLHHRK